MKRSPSKMKKLWAGLPIELKISEWPRHAINQMAANSYREAAQAVFIKRLSNEIAWCDAKKIERGGSCASWHAQYEEGSIVAYRGMSSRENIGAGGISRS